MNEDNLELLKELSAWDFPNTEYVPNGYDMSKVPKMSDDNFRILLENHNKLVNVVNALLIDPIINP